MKKPLLMLALAGLAIPAAAQAWTKTYVVNWIEPALYYGGPESGAADAAGADCPRGINDMDWDKQLLTAYRPAAKVKQVHNPEYSRQLFLSHLGFRGPDRENVYDNPTSVPDQGMIEVTGKIAEGFDLDDDPKTGFVGPDGQTGVDNAFYKVTGCVNSFRGKQKEGFLPKLSNEQMREGAVTLLMVLSGAKEPANDDDVSVGIYTSQDRMTKDANDNIAPDYSFRIDPKGQTQTLFRARIANGVVTAIGQPTLKIAFSYRNGRSLSFIELFKSQARLEIQADGSMKGLVAGYRPFVGHFTDMTEGNTITAAISENLGHFNLSAWYYAMRREADGLPDPVTGKNAGISTVYRLSLTPAFVIDPRSGAAVKVAQDFRARP